AEDGIRDFHVTGVQTCALPISAQGRELMTDILMPALSPTMEEGVLSKWHVKVGDTISAGDVIAEIETDKATMEVEAVDEGEVARSEERRVGKECGSAWWLQREQ